MTLEELANKYGVELAAVKAVIAVESAGSSDAFLFEPHIFHKETGGKFDTTHPHLSSKVWNKALYKNNMSNYKEAYALDPVATMKSTSWGRYQIMGQNSKLAGFGDVVKFVEAMKSGEEAQNKAFFAFLSATNIIKHLKSKNWEAFAKAYNGPGYKKNKYDTKLQEAYAKLSS